MKKFKQCAFTVLLLVTCFVASPFMIAKIWKSSSDSQKKAPVQPPSVSSQPSAQTPVSGDTGKAPEVSGDGADAAPLEGATAAADNGAETPDNAAPTQPAADNMGVVFTKADPSYFDDALFIGDSRMVGIRDYGTIKNSDYFCTTGLAAYNIDSEYINGMTFDQTIKAKKYGKVYIMLGLNEVGNDYEYTLTAYRSVVERIKANQPDAIIYVCANLHVSAYGENYAMNITVDAINNLNNGIASFADNKKIFYLDVNPVFDDASGFLTADYTSDGVHPYAKHYAVWCDWISSNTVRPDTAVIYYDTPDPQEGATP